MRNRKEMRRPTDDYYRQTVIIINLLAQKRGLTAGTTFYGPMTADILAESGIELTPDHINTEVIIKLAAQLTAVKTMTLSIWLNRGQYRKMGTRANFAITAEDVLEIMAKNQSAIKGWMTVAEASTKYGVQSTTIKYWCANKSIGSEKDIIGKIRISPDDYEKLAKLCQDLRRNDVVNIDGKTFYALSKATTDNLANLGVTADSPAYSDMWEKCYQRFHVALVAGRVPMFSFITFKKGKQRRIYIPEPVYTIVVNMVSVRDAARMCGVSEKTIYNWNKRNKVKVHRKSGLDAFLLRYEFESIWMGSLTLERLKRRSREGVTPMIATAQV